MSIRPRWMNTTDVVYVFCLLYVLLMIGIVRWGLPAIYDLRKDSYGIETRDSSLISITTMTISPWSRRAK